MPLLARPELCSKVDRGGGGGGGGREYTRYQVISATSVTEFDVSTMVGWSYGGAAIAILKEVLLLTACRVSDENLLHEIWRSERLNNGEQKKKECSVEENVVSE